MRLAAERMATSPVPPKPEWQQVTIADAIGYMFMNRAQRSPEATMPKMVAMIVKM